MQATLVANPSAGSGRGHAALAVAQEVLRAAGWELEIMRTQRTGQAETAATRARDQGQEAVVVIGGDGTISEVVNALVGSQVVLGVVPAGTGNVYAREMGIPHDPEAACRWLLTAKPVPVDVGKANDRCFLLMAGIGFDAQVVKAVGEKAKGILGSWAYVLALLREAWRPQVSSIRAILDGESLERKAWLVMVSNSASYAWRLKVCPQAKMADGLLDLCLFVHDSAVEQCRQLFGTTFGRHLRNPQVLFRQATTMEIEADPPLPFQLDGDLKGFTPLKVSVIPLGLRILAQNNIP